MSNRAKKPEHETRTDLNKIFFGCKSFKINKRKLVQNFLIHFETILKINRVLCREMLYLIDMVMIFFKTAFKFMLKMQLNEQRGTFKIV